MARSRLTREEALAGLAAYEAKHGKRGTRKAYAALGDDTTLSRFVKIKGSGHAGARKSRSGQLWLLDMRHKALELGRSIFKNKGVKPPSEMKRLLVSGHSNVKIGRDVRKGKLFRGYWIYTLTLEERATCPRTCHHWETCYGNNMPWATRVEHGPALMRALEVELRDLLAKRGRVGILVRLHALGDFYSVEYVHFWRRMLDTFPNLAIFGYTARRGDPIAYALQGMQWTHGDRFRIRWSDGGLAQNCTVSVRTEGEAPADSFTCPEQTGKTACCATCGLCWNTSKNVAFLEH